MAYVDRRTGVSSDEQAEESPITEPVIITTAFITGGAFEATASAVRMVGWEETQKVNGLMVERRIVTRRAMTKTTARDILAALRQLLNDDLN